MNIQQLEYIVAIDDTRHFAKAAGKCFVTQPTLSMMVQKLEEELQCKVFDRNKQPVEPTRDGAQVIKRARSILIEVQNLKQFTSELTTTVSGQLRLGIIPTLAPYILPFLVKDMTEEYPHLALTVSEMVTDQIVDALKKGNLDMALLATPLLDNQLTEYKLFDETFFAYVSESEKLKKGKYIYASDLERHKVWLLAEGHCFRHQVLKVCGMQVNTENSTNLHYEAGSIETLINLVDRYQGITIIPQLAVDGLSPVQKKKIREFAPPRPAREISLVVLNSYPRQKLIAAIRSVISKHNALSEGEVEIMRVSVK